MFTCQLCNGVSKPRQRPSRVVVEKRHKTYFNPLRVEPLRNPISQGWEIVRELIVCAACALSLRKEEDVNVNKNARGNQS